MRKIKFKAVDLETKEIYDGDRIEEDESIVVTLSYGELVAFYVGIGGDYQPLKLIQGTGLKHRCEEIFEGDVLQWTSTDSDGSKLSSEDFVVFENGQYWVKNIESNRLLEPLIKYLDFDTSYENVSLIGNIYENPKLLMS